jgi:hypothetical protein
MAPEYITRLFSHCSNNSTVVLVLDNLLLMKGLWPHEYNNGQSRSPSVRSFEKGTRGYGIDSMKFLAI